jgi:hypothetical protein
MASLDSPKLVARNVAALRRFVAPSEVTRSVSGNPVSSRLESGVGNCFPGLECDLRNLERRFLPFVEVDAGGLNNGTTNFEGIIIVSIDIVGVEQAAADGAMEPAVAAVYRDLSAALGAGNTIAGVTITGTFGIIGDLELELDDLAGTGADLQRPPDLWSAIRMLTEGTMVSVDFVNLATGQSSTLTTTRARYLDDNGALSAAFLPGELTQSLCSPWTHDFRDCGCYYWASNHPDIVQPTFPAAPPAEIQPWTTDVVWQRRDRQVSSTPPPPASDGTVPSPRQLFHYEINERWQELHFVVNRREITTPYKANDLSGTPLLDRATLLAHLRYAAGVELAVAQEYLSAAYSLKADNDASLGAVAGLRDDVRATRAELMRIGIGEMRHTRAVNDVIRALMDPGTFAPALRVALLLPEVSPGVPRPVAPKAATPAAIDDFIAIEAPSAGVDGLYFDILATLQSPPADVAPFAADEWRESISSVIAEGEDHYQTFLDIKEWLSPYDPGMYLRSVNPARPQPGQADHDKLQTAYRGLLEGLYSGYQKGRFVGASDINAARASMIASLDLLAHAVADKGFLVAFDDIADPRFTPINPP